MNREEHELLAETGRGTPMGDLLRRYWVPAVLARELETDGAPVRIRLLGEDLIGFRDSLGRPGLLDEHCAHRGASLYFAKNGEAGLRCWYHGWKYDIGGNCLEQPNEPPQARFCGRVKLTAYACVERNGVVWAYMGPPDKKPALPELEWLTVPEAHVHVAKRIQECHWTQGMEGDIDSSHLGFLHQHAIQLPVSAADKTQTLASADRSPKFELMPTPAGFVQATRRAADAEHYYWRVGQWLMPGFTTIPPRGGDVPMIGHSWTPIDDGRSWVYTFAWHPTRPLRAEERERMEAGTNFHVHLIPGTFRPRANRSNGYAAGDALQARQPWMRVKYFQDQDIAATESMGPLYDRTRETLGSTDIVIARARKRLVDAARDLRSGIDPPGDPADYRLRPVSALLPRNANSWSEALAERMDARPETYRESL